MNQRSHPGKPPLDAGLLGMLPPEERRPVTHHDAPRVNNTPGQCVKTRPKLRGATPEGSKHTQMTRHLGKLPLLQRTKGATPVGQVTSTQHALHMPRCLATRLGLPEC